MHIQIKFTVLIWLFVCLFLKNFKQKNIFYDKFKNNYFSQC